MKQNPQTRQAIRDAGFAVFGRNPGASLSDVAKLAGVGRATLHRYYAARLDLMRDLAAEARRELNEVVEAATRDATSYADGFRLSLRAILPLADRQLFLATDPVQSDPVLTEIVTQDRDVLLKDIAAAKAEGLFDPDLPDAWIAEVYEGLIFAGWTMVQRDGMSPDQAADLAWRSLVSGCGREGAQ